MENKYNGWANYETWAIKLWLDNDQGSQEYWEEEARAAMSEAVANENSAESLRDEARGALAERIQNEHEAYVDEILPSPASFLNDLVNASLGRVDWREIAAAYVDEIPVYCVGWNMPGYMPDSEPAMFLDFDDAVSYVKESIENHLEEDEEILPEYEEYLKALAEKKWEVGDTLQIKDCVYWIVQN